MALNLPDQTDFLSTNLTKNTCIAVPREARGRPMKCLGWKGGREME